MKKIKNFLVSRSRNQKILLNITSDIFIFFIPTVISFISFKYIFNSNEVDFLEMPIQKALINLSLEEVFFASLISVSLIFFLNGYRSFFRSNASSIGIERITGSLLFSFLLAFFVFNDTNKLLMFFKTIFVVFLVCCFFHLAFRSFVYRFLSKNISMGVIPILIYGAGQAGRETAALLSQNSKYKVLGFIDDDVRLKSFRILGFRVFGGANKLKKIKRDHPNVLVVLAIVNIRSKERKKIISILERYRVHVKSIPLKYGALETKLEIESLSLEDLVERETYDLDNTLSLKKIENKNVLITGAGGSIGSELACQVSDLNPSNLVLLDSSEFNLYKLEEKLKILFEKKLISFILMDIRNTDEIKEVIKEQEIDIIFHAAAYKHVPLLQRKENFFTAIKNNFFATYDLCKLAYENNLESFTLISSDKAVNPPNIMGATKRLAELSLQAFQNKGDNKTCFSMVRFGNVLNSSGSVVPLFWDQISKGGPVTVTHREVNRFFMTIEEASSLVIQSSSISKGGEVFLLDMGLPIRIRDLAKRMIHLSGNSVASEGEKNGIEIKYTGLRSGEKIFEELLLSDDPLNTVHPKIKKGIEKSFDLEKIVYLKNKLEIEIKNNNFNNIYKLISGYVDGYKA